MEENKILICIKNNIISSNCMIQSSYKKYIELFYPNNRNSFDYIIEKSENGKPYIKGFCGSISISHSGEFIVCAISNGLIGVDIEKIRYTPYEAISNRFIPIALCSNDDFLRYWVAAETVAKAENINLLGSLRQNGCIEKVTYLNFLKDYYFCYYGKATAFILYLQ